MKKINKRTITFALSLILCLAVSIGVATAYFTDYEAARGGAELNLSGQTQLEEKMDGNHKNVTISNVGETDMIVRIKAIGSDVKATNTDGWIQGSDGWWYWSAVLKGSLTPGGPESTETIRFEVTFPEGAEQNTDVIVVHEASRTVFDGNTLVCPNGWDSDVVSQIAIQ